MNRIIIFIIIITGISLRNVLIYLFSATLHVTAVSCGDWRLTYLSAIVAFLINWNDKPADKIVLSVEGHFAGNKSCCLK
jgi:Ni/Fe-hydrogenase subunit HybB-like protein